MRFWPPVPTLAWCFAGAGKPSPDHDRVSADSERLDEVTGTANSAVGDHVDVPATRFVEVVTAGCSNISDRSGHGDMNT